MRIKIKHFINKLRKAIYNSAYPNDKTAFLIKEVKKTIIRQRYEQLSLTRTTTGISDETYEKGHLIIVSLTTYGARAMSVYLTIESIMQQTLKPNKIVLTLDQDEFNKNNLPLSLKRLQQRGLEIIFTEDIKSYKKLIPVLRLFPEDIIVTVDDDVIYPPDMLERLYLRHNDHPNDIICCHAHIISFDNNGNACPYLSWADQPAHIGGNSKSLLPVGIGGILYPPHCLHQDVDNVEKFLQLSPMADDLWFKIMAILKGTTCVKIPLPEEFDDWITTTNSPFDYCLSDINSNYANDVQWNNLLSYYRLGMYDFDTTAGAERFLPEQAEENIEQWILFQKHFFAYTLANKFIKQGARVLEIGCGDGYGANYLVANGANVLGIDVDIHSINYAQKKYQNTELSFQHYNGEKINCEPHSFDMVISFQVMEHVKDVNNYLGNIKQMLKPDGIYIITTPSRTYRLSPGQKPNNPFHLREYDSVSLKKAVEEIFPDAKIYGISAIKEVIDIEKERCRSSRNDYNPKEFHYVPHRANYRNAFSSKSFFIISKDIDNGLDLLVTNNKLD